MSGSTRIPSLWAKHFASAAISGSSNVRRGMKVLAPMPAASISGVVAAAVPRPVVGSSRAVWNTVRFESGR